MSLPKPEGIQKNVLCLPENGHYVVLGTAGSGKTTLAIHRSVYLANRTKDINERLLLVTFNKALVTYLNAISDERISNIDVHHYHKFAKGYLSFNGLLGNHDIVPNENMKLQYIISAIGSIVSDTGMDATFQRAPEVFLEEISWIQKMGISNLEDYIEASRVGRGGTRITREKRHCFYKVYEKYLEIRAAYGYRYDWDDIANTVVETLIHDKRKRLYKHIIIDEGQDLSPVMLKSLALAVPEEGSITFFGDVAQQIYGGRISWRDAGLNIERDNIWRFNQNYRNSQEIAKLAVAVSKHPKFKQSTDLVIPLTPKASGPKPALLEFNNENSEIDWIVKSAISLAQNQTVGILVRTRDSVNKITSLLANCRVRFQELHGKMGYWNGEYGISVGTFHSAKGLEFDAVLVPYCSAERIPDQDKIIALEDRDEALSEDIKLLYVAITRAKRTLVITYATEASELLPSDALLYQIHKQ